MNKLLTLISIGSACFCTPISNSTKHNEVISVDINTSTPNVVKNTIYGTYDLHIKSICINEYGYIDFNIESAKELSVDNIYSEYTLETVRMYVLSDTSNIGRDYLSFQCFLEANPTYLQDIYSCFPVFSVKYITSSIGSKNDPIELSSIYLEYEFQDKTTNETCYMIVDCNQKRVEDTDIYSKGYFAGYEIGFERGQNADCWWHTFTNWCTYIWESIVNAFNSIFNPRNNNE